MGLPLINWILIHEFQGPIIFGIKFDKINFYTFFAQLSPLFSDRISDKISDLEIWLNRPTRWRYVSTTKIFRAIEVVPINEKDKIDESFRSAVFLIIDSRTVVFATNHTHTLLKRHDRSRSLSLQLYRNLQTSILMISLMIPTSSISTCSSDSVVAFLH